MCDINSTEVDFTLSEWQSEEWTIKWLHLCKSLYVDRCNLTALKPSLANISALLGQVSYTDCMSPRELSMYCVSVILSVAILLANATILVVIKFDEKLQTITNIAIVSLALSDFLTGLTFMYSSTWNLITISAGYDFDFYKIQYYIHLRRNYYLVLLFDGPGLLFTCLMSSVLSLVTIATERYVAIFYPYNYPYIITKQKMVVVVVIVWIISMLVGILPLCGWNNYNGEYRLTDVMAYEYLALWSAICFLSAFVILLIYIRIFIVARKHTRQIEARIGTISAAFSTGTSETSTADNSNNMVTLRRISHLLHNGASQLPRPRHSTIKAIKTIAIILGGFYCCWVPFLVYMLVQRHEGENVTLFYLAVITEFNSLFNPLVYGLRNRDMKKAIKKLLTCEPCRNN